MAEDQDGNKADSTMYQALVTLYIHQNQLFWGNTRTLIAIQGAVIASGYVLRHSWLGPVIMFLGAILTALLLLIVIKHENDRDANLEVLDKLSGRLDKLFGKKAGMTSRFNKSPQASQWLRGGTIMRIIVGAFILLDAGLAVSYYWSPEWFPKP